jgi:eukaryotic-like serine/threonine-protein kinase
LSSFAAHPSRIFLPPRKWKPHFALVSLLPFKWSMETTQRTSDRPATQVRADFSGTARFQVLSRLGQGGGGVVYEALDRERKTRIALKTLRVPSAETLLRLKKEFRSVQDIRHPNLVQLGELFEEDGQWFFTMEFVEGLDFTKYVRGNATAFRDGPASNLPFNEERLRAALIQLVSGVHALHQGRKVHRDLKPSNVLVTLEGRVVILDFGVMSDLENIRERASEEQSLIGTAGYMAPEQAKGQPISPAADWYAVGTMIFSALTGRLPFVGTFDQILEAKTTKVAPLPQTLVEALPVDLCELCEVLLRTDPTMRPSGSEILDKLRAPAEANRTRAATYLFVGRKRELSILDEASKGIGQRHRPTLHERGAPGTIRRGQNAPLATFSRSTAGKPSSRVDLVRQVLRARVGALQGHRCHRRRPVASPSRSPSFGLGCARAESCAPRRPGISCACPAADIHAAQRRGERGARASRNAVSPFCRFPRAFLASGPTMASRDRRR